MKTFLALSFLSFALPAAAQICHVDQVDRYNRVIRTFTAYGDANSCVEGMKECRKDIALNSRSQGADCVRRQMQAPQPPRPQQPIPQPQQPYPQPQQPYPSYGIELNRLSLDLMNSISSSESKTKVVEKLISRLNSYELRQITSLCSSTRSWSENVSCLQTSIQRAPIAMVDELSAQRAVGASCSIASSWSDEANCFKAAERHFPSLGYLTQTCRSMYSSQSQSECFRQIFGQ